MSDVPPTHGSSATIDDISEADLEALFEAQSYVADADIVTTVFLGLRLGKPILIEGEPGSGKTELGKVLAAGFDTELVRLQCYEGLTAENVLYEWNYTKQMLAVQSGDHGVNDSTGESVFSEDFLLERPLLRALTYEGAGVVDADDRTDPVRESAESVSDQSTAVEETPAVLLIDEIDRADEEFEAMLLEILSDFQVSIPELGTIRARRPPIVVITSNRTRGLSDALKRRCLYLHLDPPSFEKERAIVRRKVPDLDAAIAAELCGAVERLREEPLLKRPGVAETLDWARAIETLRDGTDESLSNTEVRNTLGCLLKEAEDVDRLDDTLLADVLDAAETARSRTEESAE